VEESMSAATRRRQRQALLRLRHPEVVSGHVAEAGVDAVRLLARPLRELDARLFSSSYDF